MHRKTWRPIQIFLLLLGVLSIGTVSLCFVSLARQENFHSNMAVFDIVTSGLGLTDICVATEARYTRHPVASDPLVPFMDHPGAIEHFPTGSFWTPPSTIPGQKDS